AQGGKGKAKPPVTRIERLVARPSFQIWCSVVILMNCLRVAFYTDWTIRNSYARLDGLEKGVTNFWFDAPFAVWFCFEVCLRMYAAGIRSFYCDEDKYWNIFDTLLALESALSLMMRLTTARFSALRVLCIFRVARLVKHMDMVQGLRRMRAVFIALSTSVHDFASAAVVVGVVLFAYSVFLSMAAASYFERMDQLNSEQPLSAEQLQEVAQVVETFGSLPNMMVSLWAAISGGDDWMSYGDLLKKMDPAHRYFWTFVCFTAFSVVGLLNVVTGVFVDSAVSAAEACKSEDEVTASQRKEEEVEEKKLKAVLVKADEDGSGHITSEELDEHLAERNNQALWSHLGFAPKQVKMIFKLKERWAQNREGTDKVDELLFFMRNCKGPASHVDILSLMYDHMQLATSMQGNFTALQKSIDKLEQKLGASGWVLRGYVQAWPSAKMGKVLGVHVFDWASNGGRVTGRQRQGLLEGQRATAQLVRLGDLRQWQQAVALLVGCEAVDEVHLAAIRACGKAGKWQSAVMLLELAQKLAMPVDSKTLGSALRACVGRSWPAALQVLRVSSGDDVRPGQVAYNIAVSACERSGAWQPALQLLAEMKGQQVEMDAITCCSATCACAKGKQWRKVLELWRGMEEAKIRKNTILCSASINACAKATLWQMAIQVLSSMKGIQRNTITLNSAISACGKGGQWIWALRLLSAMPTERLQRDTIS
ncbi:unnamed protein product, partial [Effrenium voratum]